MARNEHLDLLSGQRLRDMPGEETLLAGTHGLYQSEMTPYASRTLPHVEIDIWIGDVEGVWASGRRV